MVGMSGGKYRHFINNLIRGLPNPSYLEDGYFVSVLEKA